MEYVHGRNPQIVHKRICQITTEVGIDGSLKLNGFREGGEIAEQVPYLAPEQVGITYLDRDKFTTKTDIWSVGCLFWDLLFLQDNCYKPLGMHASKVILDEGIMRIPPPYSDELDNLLKLMLRP